MFKLSILALASMFLMPATTSAEAETHKHDVSCEICRKTDKDGNPCKGKVTRESTSASGIKYSCSNGHTFTVEPKVRVR